MPEGQSDDLWRRRASSFGAAAAAYAEHRPDYSADAVSWLLAGAERDVTRVLDLAAGTGAVTGTLLGLGLEVVAVEPDPAMLDELRAHHPAATAVLGSAEAIPLADASVDAALVGTAFHWFDHERALPEIARVLRPGGVLGTLYNHSDDSVEWVAQLDAVSRTSASSRRRPSDAQWALPAPASSGFGGWVEQRFPHRHRRTAESLTATIGTHSHTQVVSAEEREETLGRIRAFLDMHPETSQGEFDVPLTTVASRTVRVTGS